MPRRGPEGRTRIVIADNDRRWSRKLCESFQAQQGFDVVGVAADGNEAIHLVEALKPSLVVMDSALPVLDGIEAARKMLELSDKPKVVLMFGEDHAPDSRALGASAVAYVKKSSDLGSVMDVVVALAQVGVT